MRITNRSSIAAPRRLWISLANEFNLLGPLPGVGTDEFGMYDRRRVLQVIIKRRQSVSGTDIVVIGDYCFGLIRLMPCHKCTVGFVTQVYLHELVHAWLHQYHPALYEAWDSCPVAETFSQHAFRRLGGTMGKDVCNAYVLNVRQAQQNLNSFRQLTSSLVTLAQGKIPTWSPPSH
jgi:hypothetical protein